MNRNSKMMALMILSAIVGLFVIVLFFMSFYTVDSGTRKIVLTAGEATAVSSEGLNFKIPFYQTTHDVNIRTHKTSQLGEASSRDLQVVTSTISVNYHYDSSKLIEIYSGTGFDIDELIINPRIQEALKSVAAKYTAEGLISKRALAKAEIDQMLKKDLIKYNIIVEDVQLTEFKLSKEFNESIESKQIEEQNTQKAENILQRTKIEAEQRVAQAKGEAEAIRIQAAAIQAQGGEEYVKLKQIEKWNGVMPTTLVVSSDDTASPMTLMMK